MGMNPSQDLGGHIALKDGNASATTGAPILVVAAGAGDAVKVTGQTVDRRVGTAMADSAVIGSCYLFALTDTKTLSLAHEYQESDDDSTWDTAVVIEASTVKATGTTGGTNERGVDEHTLNLRGLKRYVRVNVTPDLSAGATDTGYVFTVVALGGYDQLPQ